MIFEEFGLAPPILRAIVAEGYSVPTPIQSQAIPHLLSGSDLVGCAQTGTGKTAAYALPILHRLQTLKSPLRGVPRSVRVLVLSPTRELAVQISDSIGAYGRHIALRQAVVVGGVNQQPQVRALQQGVDVLVATPGRLMDLIQQGFIDLRSVETLVIDEADRMLDMGFLPDLRRVIARLPVERQTVLFSATMPAPIEQLANSILRNPVRIRIAHVKATADLIEQTVCFISKQHKSSLLAHMLASKSITRAIVFTRTKRNADRVARHLNRSGIRAEAMHGDKSQSARQRTLSSFKSNRPPILVATDLAARGIDIDGVSHVFNFDMPHEPETYVHRIGRTGRAGATGMAVSFCDNEERSHLKSIERLMRLTLRVDAEHGFEAPAMVCSQPAGSRRPRKQFAARRPVPARSGPPSRSGTGTGRGAGTGTGRPGKFPTRRAL